MADSYVWIYVSCNITLPVCYLSCSLLLNLNVSLFQNNTNAINVLLHPICMKSTFFVKTIVCLKTTSMYDRYSVSSNSGARIIVILLRVCLTTVVCVLKQLCLYVF